jgi:putative ABC transport system permease protein
MRARSELRSDRRSLIGLAVMLGLVCAVVLTAAEGARRTDTAYARFAASLHTPNVFVLSGNDPKGPMPVVDLHRVLTLPQVQTGAIGKLLFGVAESMRGDLLWGGQLNIGGPPNEQVLQRYGWGAKLLAGRFPDPTRPDEVVVGYRQHPDPRMRVGDTIRISLVKPDVPESVLFNGVNSKKQVRPPLTVHIVGEALQQGELQGSYDVMVTPAFFHAYSGKTFTLGAAGVALKHGFVDFPAFSGAVQSITPGALLFAQNGEQPYVNRTDHTLAVALWLFAGITALAGLLIFAQALSRNSYERADENPSLHALGMTRSQLFGLTMIRAGLVAVAGAAIGITIAFLASPMTPFGRLARVAEPQPGFSFDTLVLVGVGMALVLVVVLLAVYPAWRTSGLRGDTLGIAELPGSTHPSRFADGLAQAGLSPAGAAGVRMALQPGRGRTSTPIRVTVFGAALSLAALATAFVFGSSFQHLFATPRLYGNDWSFTAGSPYVNKHAANQILHMLQSDPRIGAIGEADIRESLQFGKRPDLLNLNVFAYQALRGRIGPTIVNGRAPASSDEIALGTKTIQDLGLSVGDRVDVSGGHKAQSMRIVGTAVLPVAFGPGLGVGAAMTLDGMRHFIPHAIANGFAARVLPGSDPRAVIADLNKKLAPFGADAQSPLQGTDLESIRRVESFPYLLAALLGLAALATLAHTLISSVRKRRRDFAILKTLGFERRQVSATVAWQSTTIALIAAVIGIPIGIAIGRWGWNIFSEQVGVVPEPVTPVVFALLLIPATLLFANVIAALPARIAGRLRPAPVLRTE